MNPHLSALQPYPFAKLATLLSQPSQAIQLPHIALSIGEPKHAIPAFVKPLLAEYADLLSHYPPTAGSIALREVMTQWIEQRYNLTAGSVNPVSQVITAAGTREALFGIAQCTVDASNTSDINAPIVIMPNPCYQIYEGAAIIAGAEPYYLSTPAESNFLPDYQSVPEQIWQRTQLLYYCSPGNPAGAFHSAETIEFLIEKSQRYNFTLVADECYSEIYTYEDHPPVGLLQTCLSMGITDFHNCIAMNSLSKRSNLAGLRSGLVAGDAEIIKAFTQLKSYQGTAMSPLAQKIAEHAWADESHVIENRSLYQQKLLNAQSHLSAVEQFTFPWGGFFLWLKTPEKFGSDIEFTAELFNRYHVTVLPGQYLGRNAQGLAQAENPAQNFVRVALVSDSVQTNEALDRLNQFYIDITR
jgi:N-succinyldiaminopimelate aminotransferase